MCADLKTSCTSALSPLPVKPLVLSLKLVTSQNTTHSQAPCHNTGSHAFQVHSMSIVHRRLRHMPRTAHLTLSWRSLSENQLAHRRHFQQLLHNVPHQPYKTPYPKKSIKFIGITALFILYNCTLFRAHSRCGRHFMYSHDHQTLTLINTKGSCALQ